MAAPSADLRPLMPGIQGFVNRTPAWGQIWASAAMLSRRALMVFAIFQRWFIDSVASSGVTGSLFERDDPPARSSSVRW